MSNSENMDLQEFLKHEFESWQKLYYDDVYSLFIKGDGQRLVVALEHWDDKFMLYLQNNFTKLVTSYEIQTMPSMSLTHIGEPIKSFKAYRSNQIEAFLTQCIEEAKKGNLSQYYISPDDTLKKRQNSLDKKPELKQLLTIIFVTIPKTIGRLLFDIVGQGDKAALSSTVIVGYIIIVVIILLGLRILSPNTLIDIYHFFFPEPK